MAPSATSSAARVTAGTSKRSEKSMDQIRPVSATVALIASSWSIVVQPGLSVITSLPACIARMAISGAVTRNAGQQDQVDGRIVQQGLNIVRAGHIGKRSRKPSSVPG
jgi:hypothetical protein